MKPKRRKRSAHAVARPAQPKTVIKYRKKAGRVSKRIFRARRDDSLEMRKLIRGSIAVGVGMVVAKAAVNKLTAGGSETERWSWPNIMMAAGSALVVAFAGGAILKLKKPTVAMVAMGGIGLALYKIFTTKLAPRWSWSESWFGGEDEIDPAMLGTGARANDEIEVFDYEAAGALPGQMLGQTNAGGLVVPYNPYMGMGQTDSGGRLVPYNPNMGADNYGQLSRRLAAGYPGSY